MNFLIFSFFLFGYSQDNREGKAVIDSQLSFKYVKSIKQQIDEGTFVPSREIEKTKKIRNDMKEDDYNIVIGKSQESALSEKLVNDQIEKKKKQTREPELVFEPFQFSNYIPSDPTGAAGPDHYIAAWNSSFRIFDKTGTPVISAASLATVFGNDELGDPIVLYDAQAERFILTSMGNTAVNFAITEGSNPYTDGWYVYTAADDTFSTGDSASDFPDYPKYSIWSDAYYLTTNYSNVPLFALERDKILDGDPTASIQGMTVSGMVFLGFRGSQVFSISDANHPEPGNATLVLHADGALTGLPDQIRVWTINVDWENSANTTVSAPEFLYTVPFNAYFDGGDLEVNLTQMNGTDMSAGTQMISNQSQFRKFGNHNSALVNFTVNAISQNPSSPAEQAGIRWIELRQDGDGQPWYIYQEGTYVAPNGKHAIYGSMAMDFLGNIGMGYTSFSENSFIESNYTGRFSNDELGVMTIDEQTISTSNSHNLYSRYADYSHLTVDPSDDKSFWFNTEFFRNNNRRDVVGVFKIASDFNNDIGVVSIDDPVDGTLSDSENISVTLFNYGQQDVSDFDISYQVDSGDIITETFSGTLESYEEAEFTFSQSTDFSVVGQTYEIFSYTSLENDEYIDNDGITISVTHLNPNDIGVSEILSPSSGANLSATEQVTVVVTNYGGATQNNFDVSYQLDSGDIITENVVGPLEGNNSLEYTFTTTLDLYEFGSYSLTSYTSLTDDSDSTNDSVTVNINNINCSPSMDCSFNDGFQLFQLGDINNESGCEGYGDFTDQSTDLEADYTYDLNVITGYGDQNVRVWIDFNNDFVFSLDEIVVDNFVIAAGSAAGSYPATIPLTIPAGVNLGEHILRAKTNWQAGVPDDACEETQYGETEDYTVNIVAGLGVDDIISNSEFKIVMKDNYNYEISLITQHSDNIIFKVYNVTGQSLISKKVSYRDGKYTYNLDMSYAATGVYMVRMGNNTIGYKVGKIIVK
jgi:hypothetical protein